MDLSARPSWVRRLYEARYLAGFEVALAATLAFFRPPLDSWRFWLPAAVFVYQLLRLVAALGRPGEGPGNGRSPTS